MEEESSSLKGHTQLDAVLLIALVTFAGEKTHAIPQFAAAEGRFKSHLMNAQWVREAQDFPAAEYARLKAEALSKANGQPGPRIRNPRLSRDGIDLAVLAVLDEQRRYLLNSAEPGGAWPRRRTATAGLLRTALPGPSCFNPMILAVNGRAVEPVFTPRLGDNHFRIEGCGFGSRAGEVRLEPESSVPLAGIAIQPTTLPLERTGAWSDNQIDVRLDSHLAGNPDAMTTLVVRLADGRRLELHGCRFVAMRGAPVILKTISASWVKLSPPGTQPRLLRQIEYVSPPTRGEDIPPDAANLSALVIRSDSEAFKGGTDKYEFSALNPGWVVESIQIQTYDVACPGDVTQTEQSGDSNLRVENRGLTVNWASRTCSSFIPPMFRFSIAASEYGVKVWVMGPIGTEPFGADRTREDQKQH
jgi:hypothetical protein